MDVLPKRRLEDNGDESLPDRPPLKRRKTASTEETAAALQQLDFGLDFLECTDGYSDEVQRLARELRARLESDAKAKDMDAAHTSSTDLVLQPRNAHTDVPPPSQRAIVKGFAGPPPPAGKRAAGKMPPLPNITDLKMLTAPFTHSSTLPAYVPPTRFNTYEPLEFLGDAYIEIIATRLIHDRVPDCNVGQKSNLREQLVKNETLAQYSRNYNFTERIKVAGSEMQAGRASTKILADVFEAYVAAVILSDAVQGFEIAEKWLCQVWEPKVEEWIKSGAGKYTIDTEAISMDIKSELQKYLVSKGSKLEYIEDRPMELIKEGNKTIFYVSVYLTGWGYNRAKLGSGTGRNKQIAGAEAAKNAFIHGKAIVEDAHKRKKEYDKINGVQKRQALANSNSQDPKPPVGGAGGIGGQMSNVSNWQVSSS
jgi:ribonuclease III